MLDSNNKSNVPQITAPEEKGVRVLTTEEGEKALELGLKPEDPDFFTKLDTTIKIEKAVKDITGISSLKETVDVENKFLSVELLAHELLSNKGNVVLYNLLRAAKKNPITYGTHRLKDFLEKEKEGKVTGENIVEWVLGQLKNYFKSQVEDTIK